MREKILEQLGKKGEIPPLPDVLSRLSIKINDPDCTLEDIAALIKTEPVLAGKLTKLANSVFYGGGLDRAEDISTSIMRLGLKMVMDLAYALQIPKMFLKTSVFNQRQFWRHSLSVAILSKILGEKLLRQKEDRETAYLAGLMHDIGILVFCFLIPEEYAEFLKTVPTLRGYLDQMEMEKFGISHPELGALFIQKWWNLDATIIQAVKESHTLMTATKAPMSCSQVVFFANEIVNGIDIFNGLKTPARLEKKEILSRLGVSSNELNGIVESVKNSLEVMETILNSK